MTSKEFFQGASDDMKLFTQIIVIAILLVMTYFMYNKQLGAIPILLLALYLFYIVYARLKISKNGN